VELLDVGGRLLGLTAEVSLGSSSSSSSGGGSGGRTTPPGGLGGCFGQSLAESITLRGKGQRRGTFGPLNSA
jgi:hypothetical protein